MKTLRRKKFKQRYFYKKKQRRLHVPKKILFKRSFQTILNARLQTITRTKINRSSFIGLQAVTSGYIVNTHYEMLQRFIMPATKNKEASCRLTNTSIHFFTDHKLTAKPQQSRMGRGKGQPTNIWYAKIFAGQILVEVKAGLIKRNKAIRAVRSVMKKLPIKTRLVTRFEGHLVPDPTSPYYTIPDKKEIEITTDTYRAYKKTQIRVYKQLRLPYIK